MLSGAVGCSLMVSYGVVMWCRRVLFGVSGVVECGCMMYAVDCGLVIWSCDVRLCTCCCCALLVRSCCLSSCVAVL